MSSTPRFNLSFLRDRHRTKVSSQSAKQTEQRSAAELTRREVGEELGVGMVPTSRTNLVIRVFRDINCA